MQHLDEGTIHAWLDGALAPNEASAADAHVQTCEECARAVAEARGLIAASSRILGALDEVPALQSAAGTLSLPAARARRMSWWRRGGIGYAAAATALLAVGTTLVWSKLSPDAALDSSATAAQEAPSPTLAQPAASEVAKESAASDRRDAAAPPSVRSAGREAVADAKNVVPTVASQKLSGKENDRAKKQPDPAEGLVTDRIVQLPGAMPRPAAPPPVKQESERKAIADVAASANARSAQVLGRVVDAATGAPVVGAVVSIDTIRVVAQTDSTGKFQLLSVPLGNQTVRLRALGFQPAQQSVAVAPGDSVQLAFTLQRSALALENVVVTGTAAGAAQQRQDAQGARRETERAQVVPLLQSAQLSAAGSQVESAAGCYLVRAGSRDKARDEDRSLVASLPTRIQLETEFVERSRANEMSANRARTLSGTARAESWRIVTDSLELTIADGDRRHVVRFSKRDTRWISDVAILEPCSVR